MKTKWKVGDWCFCEMKLQQIKEMKGESVTCVTDSFFSLGSRDLRDRCFPVDLLVKNISDCFVIYEERIRKEGGNINLNWPDINGWFIGKWVEACEARKNEEKLRALCEEAEKFSRDVIDKCRDARLVSVGGVSLMRR